MTNPGQNGLSSTFSGKFPIKMLIQTVEREKKRGGKTRSGAVAAASVFSPSTGFPAQFFGECCKQLAVRGRPHGRRPPGGKERARLWARARGVMMFICHPLTPSEPYLETPSLLVRGKAAKRELFVAKGLFCFWMCDCLNVCCDREPCCVFS